jgi:hypothetical protein
MKGFSGHEKIKSNYYAHFGAIQFDKRMILQRLLDDRQIPGE